MKKSVLCLLAFVVSVLVSLGFSGYTAKANEEIVPGQEDIYVIPDKYNSGIDKTAELEKVDYNKNYDGLKFQNNRQGSLVINFYGNLNVTGVVYIENVDFTDYWVGVTNDNIMKSELKVVFRNCKFGGISSPKNSRYLSFEFYNCEMNNFSGSNARFDRCYFAGAACDGLVPFKNVYVENCYFADKSHTLTNPEDEVHIDGTQIYAMYGTESGNIHFDNCRFEMPQLWNGTAKCYINACIMLQIEYGDCDDVTFDNCFVNGGGYSIYAWSANPKYRLSNSSIRNISVGAACRFGSTYYRVGDEVELDNIYNADSLYVGSVWEEAGNTYISVSNDTNIARNLLVYTNNGYVSYTIPACPTHYEIDAEMKFGDFPFDVKVNLGRDVKWMVAYDTTYGFNKQIRFLNNSGNQVILNDEGVPQELDGVGAVYDYTEKENHLILNDEFVETVDEVYEERTLSGDCGKDAYWCIDNGVLIISGVGVMYNYNSVNTAPWYEYKDDIFEVIVENGITVIGAQAFRNFGNLVSATIADSVIEINNNAFICCMNLKNVVMSANIQKIGQMSFWGPKLNNIEFNGNINNVSIGSHNDTVKSFFNVK